MTDERGEIGHLVELGRQVDNCEAHGSDWCSCKVRQFIALLGLTREAQVRWAWPVIPEGWREATRYEVERWVTPWADVFGRIDAPGDET